MTELELNKNIYPGFLSVFLELIVAVHGKSVGQAWVWLLLNILLRHMSRLLMCGVPKGWDQLSVLLYKSQNKLYICLTFQYLKVNINLTQQGYLCLNS